MEPMKQLFLRAIFVFMAAISVVGMAQSAPYAAVVMDARDGKVIYSRDAEKPLHPASLTKMMTLYIAFSEIEAGRMSLNQKITISQNAASEPPSKIGLRAGSQMELRYLLRAAAIKSANDAATAIGEAIAGSESQFADYMTEVARSIGMKNTRFKNAHGLTQSGHYSTAYDMAVLGRRLVYDFPQYYNLFSRDSAQTPLGSFSNSNRRFLQDYPGADGIKTGYTSAAGYNLVASAKRGSERVVVSMFGGQSSYQRNQQVGALLDLGFREAPSRVAFANLPRVRLNGPNSRGVAVAAATPAPAPTNVSTGVATVSTLRIPAPTARPTTIGGGGASTAVAAASPQTAPAPLSDTRGDFAVQLAAETSQSEAEKRLIAVSLSELENLGRAKNQIVRVSFNGATMYRPRFANISKEAAYRACSRLQARNEECYVIAPDYGG